MSTTATYESLFAPTVTVTRADSGVFSAVFDIDGLEPQRSTTVEERLAGITSLDPPTVSVRPMATAYRTHRALISACQRAVSSAVAATEHDATDRQRGPAGLLWLYVRTAWAVRGALRLLDEDI